MVPPPAAGAVSSSPSLITPWARSASSLAAAAAELQPEPPVNFHPELQRGYSLRCDHGRTRLITAPYTATQGSSLAVNNSITTISPFWAHQSARVFASWDMVLTWHGQHRVHNSCSPLNRCLSPSIPVWKPRLHDIKVFPSGTSSG